MEGGHEPKCATGTTQAFGFIPVHSMYHHHHQQQQQQQY
jgi:hypothetical protein